MCVCVRRSVWPALHTLPWLLDLHLGTRCCLPFVPPWPPLLFSFFFSFSFLLLFLVILFSLFYSLPYLAISPLQFFLHPALPSSFHSPSLIFFSSLSVPHFLLLLILCKVFHHYHHLHSLLPSLLCHHHYHHYLSSATTITQLPLPSLDLPPSALPPPTNYYIAPISHTLARPCPIGLTKYPSPAGVKKKNYPLVQLRMSLLTLLHTHTHTHAHLTPIIHTFSCLRV